MGDPGDRLGSEARDCHSWSNGPRERMALPPGTVDSAPVGPRGVTCREARRDRDQGVPLAAR